MAPARSEAMKFTSFGYTSYRTFRPLLARVSTFFFSLERSFWIWIHCLREGYDG